MHFAIVGCGFVADYYLRTLALHPELKLAGVFDRDPTRVAKFSAYHGVPTYPSLEALLNDKKIDTIVNLTNPKSHFAVSKACLQAGKHVYSEKPLTMDIDEARMLVELAEEKGLCISSAPCNLLGETAQTIWKALRENIVGPVRLVYAELDDGLVPRMPYKKWASASGMPWPYEDEFEVGCTLEHAAYYLTWLAAFFGPVRNITAFSSCLVPNKLPGRKPSKTPDFSVACIQFASGVVARLTCGIVAPHDHSLRIVGDEGIIGTKNCWDYRSSVTIRRRITIRHKTIMSPMVQRYPLVGRRENKGNYRGQGASRMDFCRGIKDMALAVAQGRKPRLSARFVLHINEVILAIQNAQSHGAICTITSTFDPIEPMDWARG